MKLLSSLPRPFSKAKTKKAANSIPITRSIPAPVTISEPIPLPGNLKHRLTALRARHKLVGIGTGLAMFLGALSLLLLIQALCDWWFDLPWIARAGFLLGDLVILGTLYRRQLDKPLRRRLSLSQTALLVEKKWPKLQQSLIAAVELSEGKSTSTRGSRQLLDLMLQQTFTRTLNLNFSDVVPTRALRRWMILGGAAVLGSLAIAVLAWPSSLVLLERIALLNVPLPTRTIVVPITRDLKVPIGSDVEMSARAQGVIPSRGRLTVTFAEGPPQEFPLTPQLDKPDTFSFTLRNVQSAYKYTFYLNDGHSPEFSVMAKTPPSLTGLECEQVYPAYTGIAPRKLAPTELQLLAGSHLKIKATSTDALKSAKVILQGLAPQTLDATLSAGGKQIEADILIPAKDVTGFSLHLVDQFGVPSANETVYPIVLVPDGVPVVKVLQPSEDHETITLRAKPVIVFDASDDYGLSKLSIEFQLIPPMIAGDVDNKPSSEVQHLPIKIKPAKEGSRYEYTLDVSAQIPPWQEGFTINYWIEATDNNTATGPGVTKTEHKQFGVVSLEAKQAEILERLKANAAAIDTLSDTQTKINNDVGEAIPKK